jgi:hypothetical protein
VQHLIKRGLARTGGLWPDIRRAYGWVHQAARIRKNEAGYDAGVVERRFNGLLGAMIRHRGEVGPLAGAIDHFRKVTRSYRAGLFHCYAVPDLPRTNNDLERLFGSHRHHDRRATGRRTAAPAAVLRGPARIVAATATRLRGYGARDLAGADRQRWIALRDDLERRRRARALRHRFRRNPEVFLKEIEANLLQQTLPS